MNALNQNTPEPCAAANQFNRDCVCRSLDHALLKSLLEQDGGEIYGQIMQTRPHLFSDTVVYVGAPCLHRMAELIRAIERVIALPAYQERVLLDAPDIARRPQLAKGCFLGYDFHLGLAGPRLIEINTNAGGALLNARLAQAQRACCDSIAASRLECCSEVEAAFVDMFRAEWRLMRGDSPLQTIAIVDLQPAQQYLAPEFELFRQLFERHGITAHIADPEDLFWDGAVLTCRGQHIDLVYNRLTDFSLETPASATLKSAYEADGVVLTPHPRAHALYADKRNLVLLSDEAALVELGVDAATRSVLLQGIPSTLRVADASPEQLWQERRRWFFKPAAGFGSRAAYRGDKLTKRVFEEILQGNYIAQEIVPPSERRIEDQDGPRDMKMDLRCYVYDGVVQLTAARLYQGQTTNFRTPGGGFASVLAPAEEA